MLFCSLGARAVVWCKLTPVRKVENKRDVAVIGSLFALSLWLSNSAYVYLSVAYVQMLKALMPIFVYFLSCGFGLRALDRKILANLSVIVLGATLASVGELRFNSIGFSFQIAALGFESWRLVLIQKAMNDMRMNSMETMYYISPVSAAVLFLLFLCVEFRDLSRVNHFLNGFVLIGNLTLVFFLNLTTYLVIEKASALSLNVAGVVKDWGLLVVSCVVFGTYLSNLQLVGYLIVFDGLIMYRETEAREIREKTEYEQIQDDVELELQVLGEPIDS